MTKPTSSLILDPKLREADDPNIAQGRASAPSRHVWVRASAGSGKTKVLTDRILRFLLPDPETGAPGISPEKILCLTFTKAGAAEMRIRLQRRLLDWAVADDEALSAQLENLTGQKLNNDFLPQARRLFARILDAPGKLQVLTIHSFCQSILGRFPIETGLSPNFTVIEEFEASEMLETALQRVLAQAAQNPQSDLGQSFARLSLSLNLSQLQETLQVILNEPLKLQSVLQDVQNLCDICAHLGRMAGLDYDLLPTRNHACCPGLNRQQSLARFVDVLLQGTPSNHPRAQVIADWLAGDETQRARDLPHFKKAVLGKPRDKATLANDDFQQIQAQEAQIFEQIQLNEDIAATADLLFMAREVRADYERQKSGYGVLDYNDLIFATRRLLAGEFAGTGSSEAQKQLATSWVLYKLDEGIDHILVDESQDTNPDQWDIIRRLSEEFFSGAARPTLRPRSLFVVGDEKQSIFSFQRADPEEYRRMRDYFAEKVQLTQSGFEESFIYSFRTTSPVLKLVDETFNSEELRAQIGLDPREELRHYSFRSTKDKDLSGSVELWPAIFADEKKAVNQSGWQMPFQEEEGSNQSPSARVAIQIASQIHFMIQNGEAEAGDFMILMRTRSPLMLHVIRELKKRLLPVSGIDRLVLSESLIMQDILALSDFILLPENDFALACFLKSPFIGLSEDQLMALALNRGDASLWTALRALPEYAAVTMWLQEAADYARSVQPYEFLDYILTRPCPADPQGSGYRACETRLGIDVIDPLDEILNEALKFELQDIRTLQEFVARQREGSRQIKRELDDTSSQIRIMTVHASKGLEAKIVILADTVSMPGGARLDKFLWQDNNGLPLPLWTSGSTKEASELYQAARAGLAEKQIEEYARLLYVAMTRARDRLIIFGACNKKDVPPQSWYARIENGFKRLSGTELSPSGALVYRISPPPARLPEKHLLKEELPIPGWLKKPAPYEAPAASVVSPSRLSADEKVYSPLDRSQDYRFRRGNVTHRLLQVLPELAADRWEDVAWNFVARKNFALPEELQASIVSETLKVLRDPVFAKVFGPGSLAEVPVTGAVNGTTINGQIDRLIVTDTEILIVDFKTNRPSPTDLNAIPDSYRNQLRAYHDTLQLIYPERRIRTALLWTDQPVLMEIPL